MEEALHPGSTGGAAAPHERLRPFVRSSLERIETAFDLAFPPRTNPWRALGALAWLLFWVVTVTGIYVYAAFDTSAEGAYASVERITANGWPLSGLARSLHRYASDAFILVVVLHLVREWSRGRYAHAHRYAWITGVALLGLVYASGLGGFWLVWDRVAQFSIVATTEWLDALPIFGGSLAGNFASNADVGDRLFSLLMFLHIGFPLATFAAMGIHVKRLQRPATHPPRSLAAGTLAALVALSLAVPVASAPPADLGSLPGDVALDWFWLAPHAVQYALSPQALWAIVGAMATLLFALPYASRVARSPRRAAAAVTLDWCNGCRRCYADCPYDAIEMVRRSDGRPHPFEARVNANLCAACGICAGSCPSSAPFRSVADLVSGIDLPGKPIGAARTALERELARIAASRRSGAAPRIVIVGCDESLDAKRLRDEATGALSLLCAAQLPPSFVDYALRSRADGVLVSGCREGDCAWRLGQQWTEERFAGARAPKLRAVVPRERVRIAWAGPHDAAHLAKALADFRDELRNLPDGVRRYAVAPKRYPSSLPGSP